MAARDQRTLCTAVGFPQSQIEQKPLLLMGCRWIWWMIRPSESSTSDYIQSTQSHNEGPTPSGLLCVAGYLQGTKALGEHSRILAGGDMATWAAACCSSSRRWFRLTHLGEVTGRQLRDIVP